MEWTPEALKAEIDYRQAALRDAAADSRVGRSSSTARRPWWRRVGHLPGPEVDQHRNGHRDAA